MNQIRKLLWLEDTPELHEVEREEIKNVIKKTGMELIHWALPNDKKTTERGLSCLEHFKHEVEKEKDTPENIVGFILDVRIPVDDLSVLGMDIKTNKGIETGAAIAYCYLLNGTGESPLSDTFKDHPILMFSVAPAMDRQYPWLKEYKAVKCLKKQSTQWREEIENWIAILNKPGNRE